jgi:starch synthase
LPKYYSIDAEKLGFQPTHHTLVVQMGYWHEYATLLKGKLPDSDVDVYLIEHNVYYGRDALYGMGDEFSDNPRRFIFFSRAIFEVAKLLGFQPDVIHAHDFHCGYVMAFLKCYYQHDSFFSKTAGVFTIHNLAYQGRYGAEETMLYSGFGMQQFYPGS